MINPISALKSVPGISDAERQRIEDFMQGAIYSWAKNRPGEPFRVRDLVGGINFDWYGTPLYVLFEQQERMKKTNKAAIKQAGINLGWLVKSLLYYDKRRTYNVISSREPNAYLWDGKVQ